MMSNMFIFKRNVEKPERATNPKRTSIAGTYREAQRNTKSLMEHQATCAFEYKEARMEHQKGFMEYQEAIMEHQEEFLEYQEAILEYQRAFV